MSCRPMKFEGPARERPRCLGAAIHTALHLVTKLGPDFHQGVNGMPSQQDMSRKRQALIAGRVLVVTTGPTTKAESLPSALELSRTSSTSGSMQIVCLSFRLFSETLKGAWKVGLTFRGKSEARARAK